MTEVSVAMGLIVVIDMYDEYFASTTWLDFVQQDQAVQMLIQDLNCLLHLIRTQRWARKLSSHVIIVEKLDIKSVTVAKCPKS